MHLSHRHSNLLCGPVGQFQHPTCFACTQSRKKRNAKICFRSFSLPLRSIHDCVLPPCYSNYNRMIRKCDWRSVRQTSDHTFYTMLPNRHTSYTRTLLTVLNTLLLYNSEVPLSLASTTISLQFWGTVFKENVQAHVNQ